MGRVYRNRRVGSGSKTDRLEFLVGLFLLKSAHFVVTHAYKICTLVSSGLPSGSGILSRSLPTLLSSIIRWLVDWIMEHELDETNLIRIIIIHFYPVSVHFEQEALLIAKFYKTKIRDLGDLERP